MPQNGKKHPRELSPEILRAKARIKASIGRHSARKRGATISDFTAEQWEMLVRLHKNRCVYCGRKCDALTEDHLTALSKGGDHTLWNILPACQNCNSQKWTGKVKKPVQPLLL